jgi:hypothetical protein
MDGRCPGCEGVRCEERFLRLLALDHSREGPWGPLHGVAVACYRLQHPASLRPGEPAVLLGLLEAYLNGGLEGAHRVEQRLRRANSHGGHGPEPFGGSAFEAPEAFTATIGDVAAGGDFPAEGYAERVRVWADAAVRAWRGRVPVDGA